MSTTEQLSSYRWPSYAPAYSIEYGVIPGECVFTSEHPKTRELRRIQAYADRLESDRAWTSASMAHAYASIGYAAQATRLAKQSIIIFAIAVMLSLASIAIQFGWLS